MTVASDAHPAKESGSVHPVADQPALAGLAPRRRRRRVHAHEPAATDPVAHVVLDVQAPHLGRDFDYLVDETMSAMALPGALVRVRFAGRLVNGVVWARSASSTAPESSLRWIERVLAPGLVPDELRRDVAAIADAYGGTRANILRLAVPPRSASVDRDMRFAVPANGAGAGDGADGGAGDDADAPATDPKPSSTTSAGDSGESEPLHADDGRGTDQAPATQSRDSTRFLRSYGHGGLLGSALVSGGFASFVLDCAPGPCEAERVLSQAVALSLSAGRSALAVMPDMRTTGRLARMLSGLGLRVMGPGAQARDADVVILSASMPPADRYRAFRALSLGLVRGVIGTRAVMYAPVRRQGLFAIMDDDAYQQADGMLPYAQARGVLRLRARLHAGVFLAVGAARSAVSQRECEGGEENGVSGPSTVLRPRPDILERRPQVSWLTREGLEKAGDPAPGARVPRRVARLLSQALRQGPVLLSVPRDLATPVLGCGRCHRRARCRLCTGPLAPASSGSVPRCRWCGATATAWSCPHCSGRRIVPIRVGSTGTAMELRRMFPGVPFVVSSPMGSRGFVPSVPALPAVVVATSGFEPLVTDAQGRAGTYRAAVILDAWTSLYSQSLDAKPDVLAAWMRVAGLASPPDGSGRVVVVGQADEVVVASLTSWDCTVLASAELEDRRAACFPPAVVAACVWGRRSAVEGLLRRIGAVGGDLSTLATDAGDVPAVLGPTPIPPPSTLDERELEATRDRVSAVVRAPHSRRAELVRRLRDQTAWHVATREPGELRFRVDPKDLLP